MRLTITGKIVNSFGTEDNRETVWVIKGDDGIPYEWWTKSVIALVMDATCTFTANKKGERWNGVEMVTVLSNLRNVKYR